MSLRDSYSSPFHDPEHSFDASSLVQQITLFDNVTVESGRYFGALVDLFGVDGVVDLLESGCMRLAWESSLVGREDHRTPGIGGRGKDLPRLTWRIGVWYVTADPVEKLGKALSEAAPPRGLSQGDIAKLMQAVGSTTPRIDWKTTTVSEELTADLAAQPELVRTVILDTCQRLLGRTFEPAQVELEIHREEKGLFRAETNLGDIACVGPLAEHRLLGTSISRYVGTHKRLMVLSELDSIGYLSSDDAAHLDTRSDHLARIVTEDLQGPFVELLEASDVPTLAQGDRVDANTLLKMRDTQDARAFRDWLRRASRADVIEGSEQLGSWRNHLSRIMTSGTARKLRWLATAGLGLANPAAGLGGAGADTFVVDRLLGSTGPVGFVDRHYKPLIKSAKRSQHP